MAEFDTFGHYILDANNIQDKIKRIETSIEKLYDMLILSAANMDLMETSLDDGQTKIKSIYRSAKEITNTIDSLDKIHTRLINKLNGRKYVLKDINNV